MNDISDLLKEAKPLYLQRKRTKNIAKVCSSFAVICALLFGFAQNQGNYIYDFDNMSDIINMTQNGSAIEDLGLPVDEYGFLRIS